MRVALATYRELPLLANDDRLLQMALLRRGYAADAVVWDDPAVDWQRYGAVIVRSCWDYHRRPDDFRGWIDRLERLGVPLWNSPALLRWNLDKRYLRDLSDARVPVVPTVYLERGAAPDLGALLRERGWDEAAVKPAIAATSFHTWRTTTATATTDQERFAALLAERTLLVQPLLPQIAAGEWSLLFFGGRFSHAVLKRPAPGDFRSQDDFGGTAERGEPPPGVVEQAQAVLEAAGEACLYARVDGLMVDGVFTLMELELIEPSLFLGLAPEAAECLVAAWEGVGRRAP